MSENCIFCKIIAGDIPSYKVMENDFAFAFLDISPANRGHTLVIPKKHAADIFEVDDDSLVQVIKLTQKVVGHLVTSLGAKGASIFQLNRAEAGQTVFHLHFHVIPRWSVNEMRASWIETPGDKHELENVWKILTQ